MCAKLKQKYEKVPVFLQFCVQSKNFTQIVENFARTCVRVSVHFRNSGIGYTIGTEDSKQ